MGHLVKDVAKVALPVAGAVGGFVIGGPLGAALGASLGAAGSTAISGGNRSDYLRNMAIAGASGYAGGSGASALGFGTQTAAPVADASISSAGMTAAGSDAGMLGATSAAPAGAGGTVGAAAAMGAGAAPWYTNAGNLLAVGSGLYGLMTAEQIRQLSAKAAAEQDPFASQRGIYAQQLASLEADPNKVTKLPGYQFGLEQGNQAIIRNMAATGYTGSGNEAIALQQYNQQYAGQFLSAEQQRLASLAGASFSPSGGFANLQGQLGAANITSSALASLGYGFRGTNI